MRRFCETLGLGGYFAGVSFVLWDTRCGIPLESVGYSYGRYAWARLRGFLDPLRRPCVVDAGPPHEVGA